jgi:hypothetical protein
MLQPLRLGTSNKQKFSHEFWKTIRQDNATKRYGNPVTHKAFNPIFVKHHPLFPCHPFQEVSHHSEVQQLTR